MASESVCFVYLSILLILSIDLISDDRVSDRCEMYSYLVCPTCQKIHFEERVLLMNDTEIFKSSLGKLRIERISSGHLLAMVWISSDERFDISLLVLDDSDDQCKIGFLDRPFLDLLL